MRTNFFKSSSPTTSHHSSTSSRSSLSPNHHRTLSDSLMEDSVQHAQSIISKHDSTHESCPTASRASLFSGDGRRDEAKEYLKAVTDLQTGMHFFVTENSSSEKLVRAQNLMQIAMKRLEKEFYQILSSKREYLDPESVSNRTSVSSFAGLSLSDGESEGLCDSESVVTEVETETEMETNQVACDLKSIADCMISSGYGKECVNIYKMLRKSIIDEGLYRLGVERLSFSQVQKMDWEAVEVKIKNWLHAVKISVKKLFHGERILCDYVFQSSPSVAESCFTEISTEGAITLFGFPELVAKCKKSPEKMFRTLDLYEAFSDLWPEIESIFSCESTAATVRSQAVTSMVKLGDAVRVMLTEFESAIQKESSKVAVPGGGIHPLTRYVMNYISFLAEYSSILADIFADWPLTVSSPLPEAYFEGIDTDDSPTSAISVRLAWLILVLLCKLDGKAEAQKDVALSYLFLANNLEYVVVKVRSSNLKLLLGDVWLTTHESKVKQYVANYERMGWSKVFASLPQHPNADIPTEVARDHFVDFNLAFEETYRKQASWVVSESKLRDEIKISIARKLMPVYRAFYDNYRSVLQREMSTEIVRFAPDDLANYLSDLFHRSVVSGSVSSSRVSTPNHSPGRR